MTSSRNGVKKFKRNNSGLKFQLISSVSPYLRCLLNVFILLFFLLTVDSRKTLAKQRHSFKLIIFHHYL